MCNGGVRDVIDKTQSKWWEMANNNLMSKMRNPQQRAPKFFGLLGCSVFPLAFFLPPECRSRSWNWAVAHMYYVTALQQRRNLPNTQPRYSY